MPSKEQPTRTIFHQQNKYIPIILWLFPLLLLNIGWYFLRSIDRRWEEQERNDIARQETESLAATSEFSYRFSKQASLFKREFEADINATKDRVKKEILISNLVSRSERIFKYPFPEYELFVFELTKAANKPELLFTNSKSVISKRAISLSFEYLVKVNNNEKYSEEQRKKGYELAKSIFGAESEPEIIAETQRGKPTFSFFKLTPQWFMWDYFFDENQNVYGFYLFTPNNRTAETAGKLMTLKELRESQKKGEKPNYAAFIPLFPGYDGIIASEELVKMPDFKRKVREWIPRDSKGIYEWQRTGAPTDKKLTRVGNYKAYFHIAPYQSHASVFFMPLAEDKKHSIILHTVNGLVLTIVLFLLARGIIWGIWPQTSLKIRFITTYFLAACLPLGLLIIASYGYITEYRYSAFFKNLSQLKLCIGQFDTRKTQRQEEYKTAFVEMLKDENLKKLYEKLDTNNTDSIALHENELKEIFEASLKFLSRKGHFLPISALAVIDERGEYVANYGNEINFGKNIKLNREIKKQKASTDASMETLIYPIITSLRNRILKVAPETAKWTEDFQPTLLQETAVSAFKTAVGNTVGSLAEEFDKRRSLLVTRLVGNETVSNIHDYIYVNGVPRFTVFMIWDEGGLDDKSFRDSISYFALNEPNFIFAGFKTSAQGAKLWMDSGRDAKQVSFRSSSETLANQAFFRNSYATMRLEDLSLFAIPSKKYNNVIIVGAIPHYFLTMPIIYRICICIAIIILALIILASCLYYSYRIFLEPISKLKDSLDMVAAGKFDLEIKGSSSDEFGVMSREFSQMTKGLYERNKLATLISDHAIEALSRGEGGESSGDDVESFSGVALVSDIRNFTGMCETQEPDQVTSLLNEHFATMTKIVSAKGGRIYKYIGDAIEVVFVDKENSGRRSVDCAIEAATEMIENLKQINGKREAEGLFTYKIGVGICYGKMSSGSIGSLDTRLDYAIIGDALKHAAKLESSSRHVPEFPLVVDENFVKVFSEARSDVKFKKMSQSEEIDGFILEDLKQTEILLNNIEKAAVVEAKTETAKPDIKHDEQSFEIEETFNFASKFIPGFVFITVLATIFISGIYFVYMTAHNSEKVGLAVDNQRQLEQMLCDESAKSAFDGKCRDIAKQLSKKITEQEELSNDDVEKVINDIVDADISLKDLDFKHIFLRSGDTSEISLADLSYFNKIQIQAMANHGYDATEKKTICDIFRIKEAIDFIDLSLAEMNLPESKEKEIKKSRLEPIGAKYGDPSAILFGEKNPMVLFCKDGCNTSFDGTYQNEDCYVFWVDLHKENKRFGYFLCSISAKKAKNSVPFLLSAYSEDDSYICLKNRNSGKWHFSSNCSERFKAETIYAEKYDKRKGLNDSFANSYLDNILGVINKGMTTIDNETYNVFLLRYCKLNYGNPRNAIILVSIIVLTLLFVLWKISVGTSIINQSVAAKLWVALLIVAVLPVLTVFFVFGLFRSEYYSVRTSIQRTEMQRTSELFEQKQDFMTPLAWTIVRKKSKTPELLNIIKTINNVALSEEERLNAMSELRKLTSKWIDEKNDYTEEEKSLINFSIADISVSSVEGWNYCYTDTEDKLSGSRAKLLELKKKMNNDTSPSSASYVEAYSDNSNDSFGVMLTQVAQSLLSRRGNKKANLTEDVTNEAAVEAGLKAVRTFFGDDTFIKISHGIDLPTLLNVGIGKLGFYVAPVPSYEKPEFMVVWMINFSCYDYLVSLAQKLNSKLKVYVAEGYRYGEIVQSNDDMTRLEMGSFANWIVSSKLPISTSIKMDKKYYMIEGGPALRQLNSLLLLSCPEDIITDEINKMSVGFYILLAISMLIIIGTTRNIADDIINPVNSLIAGIKEANDENYAYRIDSDRTDELGALCSSFDAMMKGLDEKRMISKMISKTAQKVTLKADADATRKTDCVMLYVGIPDFSSWMYGLRDYDIFCDLKKHTAIIAGIIMEEGGEVDKIMGEKLLAVFRVDDDSEEKLVKACNAAKRIVSYENDSKLPFPVAIGINYGNVINGFLGVGTKRDFTIIGDSVNISARIENLAERLRFNRCLISEDVYKHIGRKFAANIYGEVELKGKSKLIKVYQLT